MALESAKAAYLRNFVFGVEDSLVSTVGLISGIAIAGMAREAIFATGIILILVEAVSMSAGAFLSESSVEDVETNGGGGSVRAVRSATIMFVSYAFSGCIPLLPYLLFPVALAFPVSIALALAALCILGFISASFIHRGYLKSAARMLLIGGAAILVGVIAGNYLRI